MLYHSTRGRQLVKGSQAILQGISPDGGLYVPQTMPRFPWRDYMLHDYRSLAQAILHVFFDEFQGNDLKDMLWHAYREFPQTVVPVKSFSDTALLELFHGPTLAFKDLALCLLPHLMNQSANFQKMNDTITILTATSGDTGKAAMSGFSGVRGTEVVVFYPDGGVADFQERQMLTEQAPNVVAFAIEGNFDDAQTGVKQLFQDKSFHQDMMKRRRFLSSANSINIGRLVPQIAYYFHGYIELCRQLRITPGQPIDVAVPTGNFGNILACVYAKDMGLPIENIICASNDNHVLSDFLQTKVYDRRRELKKTSSPSMDILISSNLERYLYRLKPEAVADAMQQLKTEGFFNWDGTFDVTGDWADEATVNQTIKQVYDEHQHVLDPHTAVAWNVGQRLRTKNYLMVVATASPYKFPDTVLHALGETGSDYARLSELSQTEIPRAVVKLHDATARPKIVIAKDELDQAIERWMDDTHTHTGQFGEPGTGL